MSLDLRSCGMDHLQEMYALYFYKVYRRLPTADGKKVTKDYLIRKISKLKYEAESNGH